MSRNDPALAARVCLALVAEGPTHGWAVAGLLDSEGAIGRIWTLSRPLTYRALDGLLVEGLVERVGTSPGGGRTRTVVAVTPAGAAVVDEWLSSPVDLPRDVRSELLVKFALRDRRGLENRGLAATQRARFAPMLAVFGSADDSALDDADGTDDTVDVDDFVARWRIEHLRAIDRFLASFDGTRP